MRFTYLFSLGFLIIEIFTSFKVEALEPNSSELTTISYSQANTALLKPSVTLANRRYLRNELQDLKKIQQVSTASEKFDDRTESADLGTKTKTSTGKPSIYVQALQTVVYNQQKNRNAGFTFNRKDPNTGKLIRLSTMLEAHITCSNEISKLPRGIESKDRSINFGSEENFFNLFKKQYETVFEYNIYLEASIPRDASRNSIKRAEKRLFKKNRKDAESFLRSNLFENPCVIKVRDCRYRQVPRNVTIYYDCLKDIFGVVEEKSNKLVFFGKATEVDYADVFRYKSIFEGKTSDELIACPIPNENIPTNPFQPICLEEDPPFRMVKIDIEGLDPDTIIARNEPPQTLEDQVDNLIETITYQRARAVKYGESVIHIITLLRIRPSERAYFMDNFKTKALEKGLDLNGLKFINTSAYTI